MVIVAGPNGAGKTTFAREYLPNEAGCEVFVNADLIAAGVSPFRPAAAEVRAGRLMLEEIDRHFRARRSFALESTLAGRGYMRRIRAWRIHGYRVKLLFLSLNTPEEAIERVKLRTRQGGHFVPDPVVRRRFKAGLRNFREIYCHCVDYWQEFDASGRNLLLLREGGRDW